MHKVSLPKSLTFKSKTLFDNILYDCFSDVYKANIFDIKNMSAFRRLDGKPIDAFRKAHLKSSIVNLTLFNWNGGVCMSSRLNVHPELKSLLATTNPDIFAYVESMVYSKVKLSLKNVLQGNERFHT